MAKACSAWKPNTLMNLFIKNFVMFFKRMVDSWTILWCLTMVGIGILSNPSAFIILGWMYIGLFTIAFLLGIAQTYADYEYKKIVGKFPFEK